MLDIGDILTLQTDNGKSYTFRIIRTISEEEGASCNVYEVQTDLGSGILRQIRCSKEDPYIRQQRDLIRRLNALDLAFIPKRVMLYDEHCYYLFSASEPVVSTFRSIIDELHQESIPALQAVYQILHCVDVLTNAVGLLNWNGFIHQDIKPENFGFQKTQGLMYADLILFDIDSLYYYGDQETARLRYTPGYYEGDQDQNTKKAELSPQTDIYSIGAVLFDALTGEHLPAAGEEMEQHLYASSMVQALPAALQQQLCEIILNATAQRTDRYRTAADMQNALQNAIRLCLIETAQPSSMTELAPRLALMTDEEVQALADAALRLKMQQLLVKHPLFEHEGSNSLQLLILGDGRYCEAFLDTALPLLQCCKKRPVISICSELEKWEKYFTERPALEQFFNFCGQTCQTVAHPYGTIQFLKSGMLRSKLQKAAYIFIDTHYDQDNRNMIIKLRRSNPNCTFSTVVSERSRFHATEMQDFYEQNGIVYMTEQPGESELSAQLEQQGRNTHQIWASPAQSYESVMQEYRIPKNHLSSTAFVASIPYKFYLIGAETTAQYAEACRKDDAAEILMESEHRRWAVDMLCRGFRPMSVADAVNYGRTSVPVKKLAACLVDRLLESEINGTKLSDISYEEWDRMDPALFEDPLDRLSISFHQGCRRQAEIKADTQKTLILTIIHELRDYISRQSETRMLSEMFRCFETYAEELLKLNGIHAEEFIRLSDLLEQRLGYAGEQSCIQYLHGIRHQMACVMLAFQFKDYRLIDRALIEQVPMIMTFDDSFTLTILVPEHLELFTPAAFMFLYPIIFLDPAGLELVFHQNENTEMTGFVKLLADVRRLRICGEGNLSVTCVHSTEEFREQWTEHAEKRFLLYDPDKSTWFPDADRLKNAFCYDPVKKEIIAEDCPPLMYLQERIRKKLPVDPNEELSFLRNLINPIN